MLTYNLAWKQLYHATWRGLQIRIDHLAKSLQRHKRLVETQASLEEYRQFHDFRVEAQAALARLEGSEKDRRQLLVQQWLGPLNVGTRHDNAAKARFGNTGEWLLQNHRFQGWFSPDHCSDPLLWLHGIPGAGEAIGLVHDDTADKFQGKQFLPL